MCSRTIALIFLLSVCLTAAAGPPPTPGDDGITVFWDTYYVNVATGSDFNNGTSVSTPFKTITKALTVAGAYDYVIIYPGTYAKATGELFPMKVPNNVRIYGSQGARMTIVDASGAGTWIFDLDAAGSSTIISGLTMTQAHRWSVSPQQTTYGGAMICRNNSAAVIEANIFANNSVSGATGNAQFPNGGNAGGGAIYADSTSTCTIRNNVFRGNQAAGGAGGNNLQAKGGLGRGGALFVAGPSTVVHNTFAFNYASGGFGSSSNGVVPAGNGGDGWAGGLYGLGGPTVANNIFYYHQAQGGPAGTGNNNGSTGLAKEGTFSCSNCTVTHNNIKESTPLETSVYPNTISFVPNFAEWTAYHLRTNTPLRGAGSTTYQVTYDFDGLRRPSPPSLGAYEPATRGDLDADLKADLLWRKTDTGENAAWIMNGLQLSSSAFVQSVGTDFQIAGTGDFNADRKTDILFHNASTGATSVMYMNGAATQSIAAGPVISPPWKVAAVADFNLDGTADMLLRNLFLGGATVLYLMNGITVMTSHSLAAMPSDWIVAGVGDITAVEGFPDVLWRNTVTGENRLWKMAGNRIDAIDDTIPSAGTDWKVMGLGDFHANGGLDILWRNEVTGENVIWPYYNLGAKPPVYTLALPDPQWTVATIGDFNGNGYDDILWRHGTSGDLAVWLMEGATIKSSGYLPVQLADPSWKVAR